MPRTAPPRRRLLRLLGIVLILLALIALAAGLWARAQLRSSLPRVSGELSVAGLGAEARIERDGLGIPTLSGADRAGVAFATGFVHAQDRFFQMDLLRRQAAGELSELFGRGSLERDSEMRRHGFRAVAEEAAANEASDGKALIEAYTTGVNAGLRSLGGKPFEYMLLRAEPVPWEVVDSYLVLLAMFADLQGGTGRRENALGLLYDTLPSELVDFMMPGGCAWDAPLVGEPITTPEIPGTVAPEVEDLPKAADRGPLPKSLGGAPEAAEGLAASNSWVVAGALASDGHALLANDMHLSLAVPNIWYRAAFDWPAADGSAERRQVVGATLPGLPLVAIGSNTHVAWGFTNSWIDLSDVVLIEVDPADETRYLTPSGPRPFERREESIRLRDGGVETIEVLTTIWGPVIGRDHGDRPWVLRWVPHQADAVNLRFLAIEKASTVDEALAASQASGMPSVNVVVADHDGRIGWTVAGKVPRRRGFDGRLPSSWADGSRAWDGWLEPSEVPSLRDPEEGRLWTANNRLVNGEALAKLGDGGYFLGARASQIRDGLRAMERPTVESMLELQLDDRALFLARWRELLLETLDDDAVAASDARAELRREVEDWGGRAGVDSVGFRVVRTFRDVLGEHLFDLLTTPAKKVDPSFAYDRRVARQFEGALWRLVSERPAHLLDPDYDTWEAMLLDVVDVILDAAAAEGGIGEFTWGRFNTARIKHPLSFAIPSLGRWLDMPAEPLPGAARMPRLQWPSAGASQRLVVSPGREDEGIFHMPGGQSGHPLSPHYRDAHRAWVEGEATPLLPGPALHVLTLTPG